MRIAIVTLPLLSNFGGILQNYALQTALKRLGHEPVTIDYDVSPGLFRYILRCVKVFLKNGVHAKLPDRFTRNQHIAPFLGKHINLTERTKTYNKAELKEYDAYIVGSDQVWRYSYSKPVIKDVYLNFTKGRTCKRISYAASFGSSELGYPSNIISQCRNLIHRFDAVSVREDSGIKICKEDYGIDAIQVIDPTLLNDKDVYSNLCRDIPAKHGILVAYVLDMTSIKMSIIYETAKKRGLEPVILTELRDGGLTIEEWLSYFRDADYIFTDSFHGTVFSIIFEKNFITFDNAKRGSERFTSLLNQFSLESRIVNANDFKEVAPIDWSLIEKRREELSSQGMTFLKASLSN